MASFVAASRAVARLMQPALRNAVPRAVGGAACLPHGSPAPTFICNRQLAWARYQPFREYRVAGLFCENKYEEGNKNDQVHRKDGSTGHGKKRFRPPWSKNKDKNTDTERGDSYNYRKERNQGGSNKSGKPRSRDESSKRSPERTRDGRSPQNGRSSTNRSQNLEDKSHSQRKRGANYEKDGSPRRRTDRRGDKSTEVSGRRRSNHDGSAHSSNDRSWQGKDKTDRPSERGSLEDRSKGSSPRHGHRPGYMRKDIPKKEERRAKKSSGRYSKKSETQALNLNDRRSYSPRHMKKIKEQMKLERLKGRHIEIEPETTIRNLAHEMGLGVVEVLKSMILLGETPKTINDTISGDIAELITEDFGMLPERVDSEFVDIIEKNLDGIPTFPRPPVVTIMGHVDHGKTTLLDALRGASVAEGEAGGITQHIGAFVVDCPVESATSGNTKVTFIDTPGHAAFSSMRARGAAVTDIIVLVVSADDGVMPQTKEVIEHANEAEVPLIVACNKMDLPGANSSKVRNELLASGVLLEEHGGDTMIVDISAKAKTNLDELLETILLQADMLELTARLEGQAHAVVVEAGVEKGLGNVATCIVKEGTLNSRDFVVAGSHYGAVKRMFDHDGNIVKSVQPGFAARLVGLRGTASAGDDVFSVKNEQLAKDYAEFVENKDRRRRMDTIESSSTEESPAVEVPFMIKTDVQGSVEAISEALDLVPNEEVSPRIIHSAVGDVTESDIDMAATAGAALFAFNVKVNNSMNKYATQKGVEIRHHKVIYNLFDDMRDVLSEKLPPTRIIDVLGAADVLQIFPIKGKRRGLIYTIAGCQVSEGMLRRSSKIRVMRGDDIVHEGSIECLKHFKEDVSSVNKGTQCGIQLQSFSDLQEGDVLEAWDERFIPRKLEGWDPNNRASDKDENSWN